MIYNPLETYNLVTEIARIIKMPVDEIIIMKQKQFIQFLNARFQFFPVPLLIVD